MRNFICQTPENYGKVAKDIALQNIVKTFNSRPRTNIGKGRHVRLCFEVNEDTFNDIRALVDDDDRYCSVSDVVRAAVDKGLRMMFSRRYYNHNLITKVDKNDHTRIA